MEDLPGGVWGRSSACFPSRIYTRTSLEQVCLDAESGEVVWRYKPEGASGEMFYAIPQLHNNMLFTGDTKGYFHCINAITGELIWKRLASPRRRMINGNPIVASGLAIVGTTLRHAMAFHANSGEIAWRTRLDGNCSGDTIPMGNQIVLTTWNTLYKLRIADGEILFRWRRKGWDIKDFVVVADRIILTIKQAVAPKNKAEAKEDFLNPKYNIVCLKNGVEAWEVEAPMFPNAMRYLKETGLLCIGNFYKLYFLSPGTGSTQHIITVGRTVLGNFSNPDCLQNQLYFQTFHGTVFAVRLPLNR